MPQMRGLALHAYFDTQIVWESWIHPSKVEAQDADPSEVAEAWPAPCRECGVGRLEAQLWGSVPSDQQF